MEIEKRQVIEDLGHWTGDGAIQAHSTGKIIYQLL